MLLYGLLLHKYKLLAEDFNISAWNRVIHTGAQLHFLCIIQQYIAHVRNT